MSTSVTDRPTATAIVVPNFGEHPIAEGKTKRIYESLDDPNMAVIVSKDDITAGDGAKHDVIPDKAKLATSTTCNVFRLLKACGVPVAFEYQFAADAFLAPKCVMLPFEVVVRREGHGSFIKRMPHLAKGHVFPKLVLEFFLKTSGKNWKGTPIPCDDPLIEMRPGGAMDLYLPSKPKHAQEGPFLSVALRDAFEDARLRVGMAASNDELVAKMGDIALWVFRILEKAWQLQGRKLVDFKVEFGLDPSGRLYLADVIDNDSWRVVEDGAYIDKQVYRDGGDLSVVAERYARVAELTGRFMPLPRQQVVVWRGSEKDDVGGIMTTLERWTRPGWNVVAKQVTCSMHKEPVRAIAELTKAVQEVPDSVVIAYVGMSNGAGPTLAANCSVPAIAVPATMGEFPNDVWSSLRMPSDVPLMTVSNPKNAALAAAQMLAMRNPAVYAAVRNDVEARLANVAPL